jgi:hypothetical protein
MYALARLVLALTITGAGDEAMKTSEGLLAAADATDNPHVVSLALSSRTPMPAATAVTDRASRTLPSACRGLRPPTATPWTLSTT